MKYDFESLIERHGQDALAVDAIGKGDAPGKSREGFDAIPMWVADMNFATAPSVCDAMRERIEHPLFGYFDPRAEYYESIIRWHRTRNGVEGLHRLGGLHRHSFPHCFGNYKFLIKVWQAGLVSSGAFLPDV